MKNILTQTLAKNLLPEGQVMNSGHVFNNNMPMLNATRNATTLIEHFFSPINVLAGRPVYTATSNSVIIHLFYYIPNNGALNNNTVNNLGDVLSEVFGRPVELRLVKLHYPYMDSYILAQFIAMNTLDYKFSLITSKLLGQIKPVKNPGDIVEPELPSYIVGLKVRVSGRLVTERAKPRKTVQTVLLGSFSKNNMSLVDYASFTSKNEKGAFTIKVWIVQRAVI